jgi:anti-sigma B factor antagonist
MSTQPSRQLQPVPLRLTTHRGADGAVRLTVAGEIDLATVDPLADAMTSIIDATPQPGRLVVDFADVTFLDSSGVSALVAAWRLASAREVDFRVTDCRPNVLRVLEITGMAKPLTADVRDPM